MVTVDDIGRVVKITWLDVQTDIRIPLKKFLSAPYATIESYGIIRVVKNDLIVLASEQCVDCSSDDTEEDLTSIHPALIKRVEVFK